ncbi:MAG: histidinol-phosphate transaminase [Eubacterium sp.]|nr:histidinol-phosphate transaminase [Eubacterium sp.]
MHNWESNVRRVVPYIPGEQPKGSGIIKLNTNENPFPPSPMVKKALDEMDSDRLRLYPETVCEELVELLAKDAGLQPSQVFVGIGSDDVLSMAFLTFFNSDKPVLFPDITYSFYDVWAAVYGIKYETLPLDDDFCIIPDDYVRENGGIVIANPNAPTGVYLDISAIEKIIAANPDSVVIVDEAYIDFGGESAVKLVDKYDNLLVVQTFSKSRSLAGMRIGMAYGSEKLIKYLNDVRFSINSYTMNMPAQVCGLASVKDKAYFEKTVKEIIEIRENTKQHLAQLGFTMTDSMTNFLFAQHKEKPAKYIFEELKKRKIFVRYWDKPRINNHLRITIGTKEQMDALFGALEEILKG